MRTLIIITCSIVYFCSFYITNIQDFGYSISDGHLANRVMYAFIHTNIVHLVANMLSFYFLYKTSLLLVARKVLNIAILIIIPLVTLGTACVLPTIGLSGVCFFLFGILFSANPKALLYYVVLSIAVHIAYFLFRYNVNVLVHITGFSYGFFFYKLYYTYTNYDKVRKITRAS